MAKINLGADYSTNPSGRYRTDGPNSGERFREEFLLPRLKALESGESLEVVLDDGVKGYGSSFLSEGFAGVVRDGHFTADDLLVLLKLTYSINDFEFFSDRIKQYIKEARLKNASA